MKRCNCISLFIINITSFFSWLFISTFCCIYVNTQRFWLFGSLVSLVIDNIIALLLSILCTLLRLISFKCNNEFFYHMAKLIDNWQGILLYIYVICIIIQIYLLIYFYYFSTKLKLIMHLFTSSFHFQFLFLKIATKTLVL